MTVPSIPNPDSAQTTAQVKAIQEALKAAGFDPGSLDGRSGPNTRKAYGAYLASLNPVPWERTLAIGVAAARYAESWVGPQEEAGPNRGRLPDMLATWSGKKTPDAAFWCARFTWFCWDNAARAHGCLLVSGQTSGSVANSWERSTIRWQKEKCLEAPVGAMIARKTSLGHHIELKRVMQPGPWLNSVGGNTSSGTSDRNGQGVYVHEKFIQVTDSSLLGAFVPRLVFAPDPL